MRGGEEEAGHSPGPRLRRVRISAEDSWKLCPDLRGRADQDRAKGRVLVNQVFCRVLFNSLIFY